MTESGSAPDTTGPSAFSWSGATLVATALVPGVLTAYLAFNEGGYFPGTVAFVAVQLSLLLALRFAAGRVPWAGFGLPALLALLALGGFAAWSLASGGWSHAPSRAAAEYDRALLYVLVLAFFASLGFSVRRVRWMVYGMAAAIVAVCAAALVARTLPEVIAYAPTVHPERLSYPLTYWNSLGILAAVGVVLCGHLACSTADRWPARVLGAAAVPLVAVVLYYTFSRGATWVALAAVAIYVLVGRPRGLVGGALATVPTTLIALMAANPASTLTKDPLSAVSIAAGQRVALTVGLCVVAAGVIRVLCLPLDRWVEGLHLPETARRPVMAAAAGVGVAVFLAGCAALSVPSLVEDKYAEFSSEEATVEGAGSSRLLSASSNGRRAHWDAATASYHDSPTRGTGAGTWAIEWNKRRESGLIAQDAHSLYLEVRGELGMVGLVLLVVCLLLILAAFLRRARGPDRALFAALFAAGLAWAVHAGIDWDWEMPAVTLWLFALGGAALASGPGWGPARSAITVPAKVVLVAAALTLAILPARVAQSDGRLGASLDSLRSGDCNAAIADARRAHEAADDRALPFQVIAYCQLRRGKQTAAAGALRQAVRRDPGNWELRHDSAVARALAGLDPRRDARLSAALNPREQEATWLAARLRGTRHARWRRVARQARIHFPGPPTP